MFFLQPVLVNFLRGDRFKAIGLGGILSTIALSLSSCTLQPVEITISSGSEGSGYQRISEQISISASTVGNITVQDNYDSQGSFQNLQRLLDKEVDFAIVQLDVAGEAMKKGQVQTIVVLTEEYLHILTGADSEIQTFADLEGKRVAVGTPGSGIYFTAKRLFSATNVSIQQEQSNLDKGLRKLNNGQVDAFIYVGPLGTSKSIRTEIKLSPRLHFIPIEQSLVNYLTIQFPESYRRAEIPQGTYKPLPELPHQNLPTISTPGALITRPDVDKETVGLLTWSILSTVRQYSPFYPELAKDHTLLHKGLIYVHPGAQQAFDYGDPRGAWFRYIQDNEPLQAALIMLIATSSIGFALRYWRKRRHDNLSEGNRQAISELRSLLEENPQQALDNVEALRQQHRLMLIDGAISTELYEEIERMTQVFADQCRTLQQQQRQKSVRDNLDLIDDWQGMLQSNPETALKQLKKFESKYREMLLSGQVNLQTYLQLYQLNLILVILFASPQALRREHSALL